MYQKHRQLFTKLMQPVNLNHQLRKAKSMGKKLVAAVKEAFKEIEYEKWHDKIHAHLIKTLYEHPLTPGTYRAAKCGVCEKVFERLPDPTPVN